MPIRNAVPVAAVAFVAILSGADMASAATVISPKAPITAGSSVNGTNVIEARWRGGGWRYGHRGYGWHHRYGRGYGWGPAIGGLAAGAVIGGAIANSRAQAAETDAYCSQRFRSYDPSSGTYLGYDGQRHPCP
ncbi:BA14K family protein [Bradyrhizobium sp. HKCCYLRH2060]|uniref:BA14K family protein n=1 Tax=Bradyrhizobium TaxID=374 RepID=UPI002916B00A|nr:BA14K family protein [Bradyrhizobium sp. SZCCHNR3003]